MNEWKSARLFFALWPDDTVRQRLVDAVSTIRGTIRGKWVKAEKLHTTLAFLGEVDEVRWPELSGIGGAMFGAAFTLRLDRVEFWPRNGIVCLGASETPRALQDLAAGLASRLADAGFTSERRPYRAHLTVARNGYSDRTRTPLPEPVVWTLDAFSLVESRLSRDGAEYLLRETWPLQGRDQPSSG